MLKIAFGVALGYVFSDVIDEALTAFSHGMNKANARFAKDDGDTPVTAG